MLGLNLLILRILSIIFFTMSMTFSSDPRLFLNSISCHNYTPIDKFGCLTIKTT